MQNVARWGSADFSPIWWTDVSDQVMNEYGMSAESIHSFGSNGLLFDFGVKMVIFFRISNV